MTKKNSKKNKQPRTLKKVIAVKDLQLNKLPQKNCKTQKNATNQHKTKQTVFQIVPTCKIEKKVVTLLV